MPVSELRVIGLPGFPEVTTGANLAALIAQSIGEADLEVKDKDIFVVAQKIVSKAEGQVLKLGLSLRWIDAGPLRYSRSLEAITLLEIGLNRRYKVKGSRVQVVGL